MYSAASLVGLRVQVESPAVEKEAQTLLEEFEESTPGPGEIAPPPGERDAGLRGAPDRDGPGPRHPVPSSIDTPPGVMLAFTEK